MAQYSSTTPRILVPMRRNVVLTPIAMPEGPELSVPTAATAAAVKSLSFSK